MAENKPKIISTGSSFLDELLQGLRPGDNVVWQVDRMEEFLQFAGRFGRGAAEKGLECVYLRFAPHPPVLEPFEGLVVVALDPEAGFDVFTRKVHEVIESKGKEAYYVFDNLSSLVEFWATDELLADFYQITCPYIYELGGVAYFALNRDQHDHNTIARIKTTTQILLSTYHTGGRSYIHPLKVWKRYSPNMFMVHLIGENEWAPVTTSFDAAAVLSASGTHLVHTLPDSDSPWNSVYRKLVQYRQNQENIPGAASEIDALKIELTRMMFGNHERINRLADSYLTVEDIMQTRERLIGSGRIGGKAAGMLLARRILNAGSGGTDFSRVLEAHDSFYIGSDVFFSFLVNNNLFRLRLNLSRNPNIDPDEFDAVEAAFLAGKFPRETMEQFRDMLEHYGQAPIIVRSSSLLEDGFQHAYAGKYRSEFCANQGTPDKRLDEFLKAVKLVYASALNPDVLSYRRRMGLTEGDEQMAILVQRVSGMPFKQYFFPTLAGVAFSKNLYGWTDRIDTSKGMVRLVFGLGTRAVNRTAGDYPRMIALSHPEIRPESTEQIPNYAQKYVDLIDIDTNQLATKRAAEVVGGESYPNLELLAADLSEGFESDIAFRDGWRRGFEFTFRNLIKRTRFIELMDEMLSCLESAWGQPVDIEFTAHIDFQRDITINLLQCRSLRLPRLTPAHVRLQADHCRGDVLFKTSRAIGSGLVEDILYIIYIDPAAYSQLNTSTQKKSLGRIIGKLSELLSRDGSRIMLIGPGRWGSGNIDLGINVSFADIAGISALVEIARPQAGYAPEVSYGTHFFLDLVEAEILYLPVYPDEEDSCFNQGYFAQAPSIFEELLPDYREYASVIRVIDVRAGNNGASCALLVDPGQNTGLCYLQPGT
ncbi:MAG: hypothetical protein JW954_02670 [Dehalococcoidaceae bacterium]|nr:hypothetical protein [Dehalococcoidaceae bacterium]